MQEFNSQLAQGAEKYFKQNYACISSNSLLLAEVKRQAKQNIEYSVTDLMIEVKTTDLKYVLDVMNFAINNQKETQEIYAKCLKVLEKGKQFIYRQIIVSVEADKILLTIYNKQTLDKIVSIIEGKE